MGYQERDYYREEGTDDPLGLRSLSMTTKIIIVTVIVYLVDMFFGGDKHTVTGHLMLHVDWWKSPWQIYQLLTYGFTHDPLKINHILFNMVGLWFFGQNLEQRWGGLGLLRFYLVSIVICGLVWWIRNFAMGATNGALIGASGGVTACIIMFCLLYPQARVFLLIFPMPAWVAGLIIIASNVAGMDFGPAEPGVPRTAFDVHLVGAAFALAVWALKIDFGRMTWLSFSGGWLRSLKNLFRSRPNLRVHSEQVYQDEDDQLEAEGDRILAKISTHGDASLTAKERKTLEQYSRLMRDRRK
ncbi:rhomboid family intramembrane serine protease [Anatilimnocola floriformis]|uniref:rhomboid family intramembrane serine protease n=1 Tax=Anatilimnocola floriformis TaxID=2948575 RepID=UPI0020C2CEF4|nr:rhomboid family intramembrane serine protease [Anatilimnocola floriformis]